MKFRFIDQERRWYRLDSLGKVMGVTRGGYWAWVKRKPSARDLANVGLLKDIRRIHAAKRGVYGSPRIHDPLQKEGISRGKKRVERLKRQNGIRATSGAKFRPATTDSARDLPVAPNILDRRFEWDRPNAAWVADTTYIPTQEGWLYLAVILDLFSRRVIGWAMGPNNDRHLVVRALRMAIQGRRPPPGLIHHSDRGSTYASEDYRKELAAHGLVSSMSRKGCCYDNAPMESWFHTVKVELIGGYVFETHREAITSIFEYMEVFYNRQRGHTSIGGFSPAEIEELDLKRSA